MENFVSRYRTLVTGVLSGFDRLVFRGHLQPLLRKGGFFLFLQSAGVRSVDYERFVKHTSHRIKGAALAEAERRNRPHVYLESPTVSKEELARKLLAKHPLDKGLICTFTTLEPCRTFEYHMSKDPKQRGYRLRPNKCLHVYKYYVHPRFGFMNTRLQTWFPFHVQICLNGREWLVHHLEHKGIAFKRNDNCMLWVADLQKAQRFMDQQLEIDWTRALNAMARMLNPLHQTIFQSSPMDYYWSAYQTEWATDLLFKDPRSLAGIYPALVRHAMHHLQSADVMRFLGKKANGHFLGELVTDFKDRPEGVRVKHYFAGNSIKMYDKAGSVLRVETTIANPTPFQVYRPLQDATDGECAWRPLRKGIADLHRRAQLSQRSNERYLDALSAVQDDTPAAQIFDEVSRPTHINDRRVRALRIGDANDLALLQAVSRGEFATAGFCNRDIRLLLYPSKRLATVEEARKLSARTSRLFRLLRAHGIIHKVPRTRRYRLSPRGQLLTAAIFAARTATLKELVAKAA